MSKKRFVGGSISKNSTGLTVLEARGGHFNEGAANSNNWHGAEKGISEYNYERSYIEEVYMDDINITLKVFCEDTYHKDVEIQENEFTYISSVPEMPLIRAIIEIHSIRGTNSPNILSNCLHIPLVLEIEYKIDHGLENKRKFRNDLQHYPMDETAKAT